jgi:divinyl chlorophyllide a 8-vinyl-reductase
LTDFVTSPYAEFMSSTNMTGKRVMVLGATGTVGQATTRALVRAGFDVTCFIRSASGAGGRQDARESSDILRGAKLRFGNILEVDALARDGFCGEAFDVVVSCLASRSGDPADAWAIDHEAHMTALDCAKQVGVKQFVLLSAICVQKPKLAFQYAKLAFEKELIESGLTYSIVRPTALFKSLAGQISRVKNGKSFLVFGDGTLTACKPISDHDLAAYMVQCIDDAALQNKILPIGGPGPAITPLEQGEALFALLGKPPKFSRVPVKFLDAIIFGLSTLGKVVPVCARKAELARIGRYYATESMLVLDKTTGHYRADVTPETGHETLFDFYRAHLKGDAAVDLGDHAVF